jgi:subtilisin-like proprotein convertase family protein
LRATRIGAALSAVFFAWTGATAFGVRQDRSPLDDLILPDPSLVTDVASLGVESLPPSNGLRLGWDRLSRRRQGTWRVQIDGRSGAPLLVEGPGIPWPASRGALPELEVSLRAFMADNRDLLLARDVEVVLDGAASGLIGLEGRQVTFQHEVNGVPVEGDRYVFYFGYGNLVSFGASRWTPVDVVTTPSLPASLAVEILMAYMRLETPESAKLLTAPVLRIVPERIERGQPHASPYSGEIGRGYASHLVWRIMLSVDGEPGSWVGMVDTHTGEVLSFFDDDRYAQVKGGVHPESPDGTCPSGCEQPNYPMPFASVVIGGTSVVTSNAMGLFPCSPGGASAVTNLASPTIIIADACGTVNETTTCDADLQLSVNSGTNCTVPAGHSSGDTKASRSCFWSTNRQKEHARAWLPANTWLTSSQTQVNSNVDGTCNASWTTTSQQLNMYRATSPPSPSGCNNTCEIAGVVQHEWGHGMDQNDGGGFDNPSEAYADISEFLADHTSCIGRGFYMGQTCTGYGDSCLTCTGLRDMDWNARTLHTPATISGALIGNCPGGSGPCGKEVHCEAYLAGEAVYDLAARDLPAAGYDPATSWMILDRLWYTSRPGSSGNMYTCTAGAGGCAATSLFARLRAVDDDDGDLGNGTPHAAAIFAAFARHGIACGAASDATNQSTSFAPVLTSLSLSGSASSNAAVLTITHSSLAPDSAASFRILRNDVSCDYAFTLVGTAPGSTTTHTDTGLANGFPLYYRVQGIGSNPAHESPVSNCVKVTPRPFAGELVVDRSAYSCSATVGIVLADANVVGSTVSVGVRSTSESTPETVILTQADPTDAIYSGSIATTSILPAADGQLSVAHGDTIIVSYVDADDGAGNTNVLREANATADCAPPLITNIQSTGVSGSSVLITWTTNEAADSRVHYGTTAPPGAISSVTTPVTSHSVPLTGLTECTDYFYSVESADAQGNNAADTNGGTYYAFTTGKNLRPSYSFAGAPIPIPDNDPMGASMTIAVPDSRTVLDVDVTVNLTHPWDSDLVLSLIPPTGAPITLSNRRGGSGDNYTSTIFDDEAATPISSGTAPFTGRFRPDSPLSAVDGISAAGNWTLQVVDALQFFTGTLDGWSLTLTYPLQACGPHAKASAHVNVADVCPSGGASGNGTWDAGETVQFSVTLENDGTGPLSGISAVLTSPTPGVVIIDGSATYPDLAEGGTAPSQAPHYTVIVPATAACGSNLEFNLQIASDQGAWTNSFNQVVGQPLPGSITALDEGFSAGIPASWTVLDGGSGGGTAATWTTANPGNRPFTPPLVAPVAIVDSARAGFSATQNEQLITPPLALSAATGVTLRFDQYFRWSSGGLSEKGDVDVRSSLTGGAWVNVLRNQGGSSPDPDAKTLDLTSQAAGAPDVQIRFHYYDAQLQWWWMVDNVKVEIAVVPGCAMTTCPVPGTAKPVASMTASRVDPITIDVDWDVVTCTSTDHELLYGTLATLPSYSLSGSVCGLGTSGSATWSSVPAGNLWFVVTGVDGVGTEASWGSSSAGPRDGNTPSGQCGNSSRDNAASCP